MGSTAGAPLTREDYLASPDGVRQRQLIQGEFHAAPAPGSLHQEVVLNIATAIKNLCRAHPIGRVLAAPLDVFLTEIDVYQPDIIFVRRERERIVQPHGCEGAPDIVVEVLSPRTRRFDLGPKRDVYARTGVEELWIADADARTIEVFRLRESADVPDRVLTEQDTLASDLLPGLALPVAEAFRRD